MHKHSLSIWFFIGLIMTAYGLIIFAEGIYEFIVPPANPLIMANLHPAVWWGFIMLVVGLVYVIKHRPGPVQDKDSTSTRDLTK